MNIKDRLERLRRAKGLTWSELGQMLELSRTMLHYVRDGERDLGVKASYRLYEAEKAAGIRDHEEDVLTTISSAAALAKKLEREGHPGRGPELLARALRPHQEEEALLQFLDAIADEVGDLRRRAEDIEAKLRRINQAQPQESVSSASPSPEEAAAIAAAEKVVASGHVRLERKRGAGGTNARKHGPS